MTRSAVYCEHANEMPATCPCDAECYCKENSCRPRSRGGCCGGHVDPVELSVPPDNPRDAVIHELVALLDVAREEDARLRTELERAQHWLEVFAGNAAEGTIARLRTRALLERARTFVEYVRSGTVIGEFPDRRAAAMWLKDAAGVLV